MWIKTCEGDLVNTNAFTSIYYDPDEGCTVGRNNHDYAVISEGNTIPQIITAIRRGDNYLGVN